MAVSDHAYRSVVLAESVSPSQSFPHLAPETMPTTAEVGLGASTLTMYPTVSRTGNQTVAAGHDKSPLERYLTATQRHETIALSLSPHTQHGSGSKGSQLDIPPSSLRNGNRKPGLVELSPESSLHRCLADILHAHKQLDLALECLGKVLQPGQLQPTSSNQGMVDTSTSSISLSDDSSAVSEEEDLALNIRATLAKLCVAHPTSSFL